MGITRTDSARIKTPRKYIHKKDTDTKTITLAGNPNVGKSTLFNRLTGLKQHTGNWAGKTVGNAEGFYKSAKHNFILTDIPGTYSLIPHSEEEKVARDFICFESADAVVVVCDATCLERNLSLTLQIAEVAENAIICVNLMDEAERHGIELDLELLSKRIGLPVISTSASKKNGIKELCRELDKTVDTKREGNIKINYPPEIERAIDFLEPFIKSIVKDKINARWLTLRLLADDTDIIYEAEKRLSVEISKNPLIEENLEVALKGLDAAGITKPKLNDLIAEGIINTANELTKDVVKQKPDSASHISKLEKIFTGKYTAYPIMLLLLGLVFWITISGANYPSALLSRAFKNLGEILNDFIIYIGAPEWLRGILMDGAYNVASFVVSVMLPPMAIFFPFFTILEDSGFLPRIAYNLDRPFKKCSACGKQALTMCMGFGCNAAGVTGARIIDSKRERLLAILTNSLVPCNGKFPAIIAIITMFFVGFKGGFKNSIISALLLLAVVVLGVILTFYSTKLLSSTLLRGVPSSFTIELPPFRKPKIGEVIVRSVFDRTLFVLGRALSTAIPAGIIIWCLANINVGSMTLLSTLSNTLNPIGVILGLDGVILLAFILGIPANEIVVPIMIMAYTKSNVLTETGALSGMRDLFLQNGWTTATAVCVIIFFLLHWPCATTLLTIKKETGSLKWTLIAFLLPTALGTLICTAINLISRIGI